VFVSLVPYSTFVDIVAVQSSTGDATEEPQGL